MRFFLSVIFVSFITTGCSSKDEKPIRVSIKDWGKVTLVDHCISRKRGLDCAVRTTKVYFNSIDITAFPGSFLKVGDKISKQIKFYKGSNTVSWCNNGMCLPMSSCYSWMPCWDNEGYQ